MMAVIRLVVLNDGRNPIGHLNDGRNAIGRLNDGRNPIGRLSDGRNAIGRFNYFLLDSLLVAKWRTCVCVCMYVCVSVLV